MGDGLYLNSQGQREDDQKYMLLPYEQTTKSTFNYKTPLVRSIKCIPEHVLQSKEVMRKLLQTVTPVNEWSFITAVCFALDSLFANVHREIGNRSFPICVIVSIKKALGKSAITKIMNMIAGSSSPDDIHASSSSCAGIEKSLKSSSFLQCTEG